MLLENIFEKISLKCLEFISNKWVKNIHFLWEVWTIKCSCSEDNRRGNFENFLQVIVSRVTSHECVLQLTESADSGQNYNKTVLLSDHKRHTARAPAFLDLDLGGPQILTWTLTGETWTWTLTRGIPAPWTWPGPWPGGPQDLDLGPPDLDLDLDWRTPDLDRGPPLWTRAAPSGQGGAL